MKSTILTIPKGKTELLTQFALEQKLEFVVKRLNDAGAWCKVEYIRDRANVLASNGQRVCVKAI